VARPNCITTTVKMQLVCPSNLPIVIITIGTFRWAMML
jgi:hypothetical protein